MPLSPLSLTSLHRLVNCGKVEPVELRFKGRAINYKPFLTMCTLQNPEKSLRLLGLLFFFFFLTAHILLAETDCPVHV